MMAVTGYVDDEKPLYVSTAPNLDITGFHDTPVPDARFISGGIYCLTDPCLDVLEECVAQGMSRMRNYQRSLVARGMRLKAFPFRMWTMPVTSPRQKHLFIPNPPINTLIFFYLVHYAQPNPLSAHRH